MVTPAALQGLKQMINRWWICCKTALSLLANGRRQTGKWKASNDLENCDQRLNQIKYDHCSWALQSLDLNEGVTQEPTVCRNSNEPTQHWLLRSSCCVCVKVQFRMCLCILWGIYVCAFICPSVWINTAQLWCKRHKWVAIKCSNWSINIFFLFFTDFKS